ncbi:MAG: glycosyltransferase family 4 protein [Deltaproteobacteria bacterium]|nr:glycosyltransferase family 4 protein [Deltaproteobacteria bacterium]MCL4874840.1 glycosyltransferase family 4 protein [bacterium]
MPQGGKYKNGRTRVAVAIPKFGLVGGGERFASELTERLALSEDYEIHVFANKWVARSGRITFHKVPMVRFPRFLRPLSFAFFAQRMIDRGGFDIVHSHDWIFRADVFTMHCVPHAPWAQEVRRKRPSLFDRAITGLERRMLSSGSASVFLPVSSIALEAFRREYPSLAGRWQTMHPGVDFERFSTPDRAACRAVIRERYGIKNTDLLLLFVGMNFEVKGLDTIIRALALARSKRPDAGVRLLVVGRGDEKKYGELARSLGVGDAVIFAGKQAEGLERYYRAADLFVMLSAFDTFGMVVLEAMAAGLPVILSPNVGAKDLVEDGVNGFVLPDGKDGETAAERFLQLMDAPRREAMGKAASSTASLHDWDRLTEKMRTVYQEVLLKGCALAGAGA